MKRKAVKADEQDAVSRYWRQRIIWQRGEVTAIKRRLRRRERHDERARLRKDGNG